MDLNLDTSFEQLHIVIIGDLILDHYLMGTVERISPEAPVPVLLHQKEVFRLGGAANVAMNVKAMGGHPHLIGTIGKDADGARLIEELKKAEIDTNNIIIDEELQTTCKTRMMARNQQLLRYDKERVVSLDSQLQKKILYQLEKLIKTYEIDVIVFQDYNKGVLVKEIINSGIEIATKNKIPSLIDPKEKNFWEYKKSTLFKPNLKEVREATNIHISLSPSLAQLNAVAVEIISRLNVKIIIITLGAAGMYVYFNNKGEIIPTQQRAVADVCGAGDTVISLLAIGMAMQLPLIDMVRLSNIGGGQVCEEVGVVPIDREKLLKEYLNLD